MSDVAIRAEGLGKQYQIGAKQEKYQTFRDALLSTVTTPLRRVRNVLRGGAASSHRDTFWALQDVSFEIRQGEAVGIIGHNGAGKSTLLKLLSRITEPSRGYAEIRGRVGALLEVGTGFHPELTGRENVYLNGAILGMTQQEIARKFDEIVAFAGVEQFVDTPVKHYSSGMSLRLGFAVAAHLELEVMIVDEVLAVGDMEFQRRCLGKMNEVAGSGRTVLFVSHNMTAISTLTQRAIILQRGKVLLDGNTKDVIQQYLNANSNRDTMLTWQEDALPGDEILRLVRVQVGDGTRSEFDDSVPIMMEYVVQQPAIGLRVGFDLLNGDGVTVFRTYHDDQLALEVIQPGHYRSCCIIPAHLLNQGQYFLTVRGGVHGRKRAFLIDNALSFSYLSLSGSNAQYGVERPGIINPLLDWTTEQAQA
jgi:lipopolysaccharide transport system ATP-binding protein